MKNYITTFLFVAYAFSCLAQGVKISETMGNPDPAAGLEIDFTDRGFLPPE